MLLKLAARMVMLSACDTGRGKVTRGEGMVGLARSFMVAGTRNVGVSLWKVLDWEAKEFMNKLYRYMRREKLSFTEAYYRVRMEYRKEGVHPAYWAAFTMYE
jgi:CHAT domain-containing protein